MEDKLAALLSQDCRSFSITDAMKEKNKSIYGLIKPDVCIMTQIGLDYKVNSLYLKVKDHSKLLISQSKFSGPRKFTLTYK